MGYAIGGGCGGALIVISATDPAGPAWGWVAFGVGLVIAAIILAVSS